MKDVGIGVVGLGRLGYVHAYNIARSSAGKLVAVCDVDENRARETATELGCLFYTSLEKMLDNKDIDAVCVVTPTAFHVDPVTAVAQAGKPLFCEKPLGSTIEENLHLAKVINDAGIFCQIGFDRRFDPAYAQARELIRDGAIGTPVYVYSVSRDPFPPPPWACDPTKGGGLFIDMLLHDFDIARFLIGDEASRVFADETNLVVDSQGINRFSDNVTVNLHFKKGALGNFHASMHAAYGYDVRTEVYGATGSIAIGGLNRTELTICKENGGICQPRTFLPEGKMPHFMFRFQEAFAKEMEAFIECVRDKKPSPVDHHDAVAAFSISMASIQAAGAGKPVEIKGRS